MIFNNFQVYEYWQHLYAIDIFTKIPKINIPTFKGIYNIKNRKTTNNLIFLKAGKSLWNATILIYFWRNIVDTHTPDFVFKFIKIEGYSVSCMRPDFILKFFKIGMNIPNTHTPDFVLERIMRPKITDFFSRLKNCNISFKDFWAYEYRQHS